MIAKCTFHMADAPAFLAAVTAGDVAALVQDLARARIAHPHKFAARIAAETRSATFPQKTIAVESAHSD